MQATLTARKDGYRHYLISDGRREFRAVHNVVTDRWVITNSRYQEIGYWTRKGFPIIAACEMAFAQHELRETTE